MKLLGLEDAVLIQRLNRFAAQVRWRGQTALAHVPNSGRLRELMLPGARLRVWPAPPGRRTACTLKMVEKDGVWVTVDAQLTNDLLEEAVRTNRVRGCEDVMGLRREVAYGSSRFDLACENAQGRHLVEAKCSTLRVGDLALFPDAPTPRGCKHLRELMAAAEAGLGAHVVILVQHPGAAAFAPNGDTDPVFAQTLAEAAGRGVGVQALSTRVLPDALELGEELPVLLGMRT